MCFKMKKIKDKLKELVREIDIPEGINVDVEMNKIKASKDGNEINRRFDRVILEKKENKLIIKTGRSTKREVKQMNTVMSHIKNIFAGLNEKFVYELEVCAVHFPMNVKVEGDEVKIKNFLGETTLRTAKIRKGVEVKVEGQKITVEGYDKEATGQTAANIEKAAQQYTRDKRIFQDGIHMTMKAGREL